MAALNQDGINALVQSIIQTASTSASASLIGASHHLLTTILFLMISWIGIKQLLEGSSFNESLAQFIMLGFTWSFAMFALDNYQAIVSDLNSGFDYIISQVTTSSGAADGYSAVIAYMFNIFDNIGRLFDSLKNDMDIIHSHFSMDIGRIIGDLGVLIVKALVYVLIAALWLLTAFFYFVMYMMSVLLFGVGVKLGPVFIPWLLFPPAVEYFNKWFAYLINAGMLKVVAFTIGAMMTPIANTLINVTKPVVPGGDQILFGDYAGMTIEGALVAISLSALMAYMMMQAPGITQAMLPGGLGAGAPKGLPRFQGKTKSSGGGNPPGPPGGGGKGGGGKAAAVDAMVSGKMGHAAAKDFMKASATRRNG